MKKYLLTHHLVKAHPCFHPRKIWFIGGRSFSQQQLPFTNETGETWTRTTRGTKKQNKV